MWRKFTILLLILTVIACGQTSSAQEAAPASASVKNWQTAKESLIPIIQAIPRYNKLRRGREELIAIQVRMGFPEDFNNGYPLPFRDGSLSLSTPAGFTIRYKNGKPIHGESPIPTTQTMSGYVAFLRVKASGNMPLGDYVIQGRLEHVDRRGLSLDVSIPITVVNHDAAVLKNYWNFQSLSPNRVERSLQAILLAPIILVWFIAFVIACHNHGDDEC